LRGCLSASGRIQGNCETRRCCERIWLAATVTIKLRHYRAACCGPSLDLAGRQQRRRRCSAGPVVIGDLETISVPRGVSFNLRSFGWRREIDLYLSTVRLSDFGLRREAPRPLGDRTPDYESLFDYDTLFYDVFHAGDARRIICLGPPLLNCEEALSKVVFRVPAAKEAMIWTYRPPRSHLQPSCQFWLTGPEIAAAENVTMELGGRRIDIPVRPSGYPRLSGRRVLVTLSKNNPLPWIRDWAQFNVRTHGADAVLFYDNGSTAYDPADVRACLNDLHGVADVLVVPWKFPFGPGVGRQNKQDSFYCQPGALEHARWRFCGRARGVLNTDIDELVVVRSGASIFDRAERSGKAAIVFPGLWVEALAGPSGRSAIARHTDCVHGQRGQAIMRRMVPSNRLLRISRLLRTKWIVLPERCPDDVDWGVHDIYPARRQTRRETRSWRLRPRDVLYRHFRQINTGWKTPRWLVRRYSPVRHLYDAELARALAIAFPERTIEPAKGLLDACCQLLKLRSRKNKRNE
jgi:hypothetical protein